jgi:hypothetical protein
MLGEGVDMQGRLGEGPGMQSRPVEGPGMPAGWVKGRACRACRLGWKINEGLSLQGGIMRD